MIALRKDPLVFRNGRRTTRLCRSIQGAVPPRRPTSHTRRGWCRTDSWARDSPPTKPRKNWSIRTGTCRPRISCRQPQYSDSASCNRRGRSIPEALFHEDFAIVPDEPIFAFAVISRVLRLEVEVIVLFPERRDAGGARRSVFAVEGGHLGAGSGLAVLHCNDETFMIACDDSGT